MDKIRTRKFIEARDLDRVMEIWLDSNIKSHSFIARSYWLGNYDYVKNILPKSDLHVVEEDDRVLGFIGIIDGYIAGIFVDYEARGRGLGTRLIELAKERYKTLTLNVYAKNEEAYSFYLARGFRVVDEKLDKENAELEYIMEYS